MSYMVARMQKMKVGNLGGAYKHNERIFEKHANRDIDTSRSHLNYELTDRDRSVSYEKQIKDYVNENKISNRAIRKDAVLCDEWIITSDKLFFEKLSEEETRDFFETAKNYFAENYGEENIAYASVHLDESTPHMHMGVIPFQEGKLSSKAMFNKEELKKIQDELPKHMNEHGYDLKRGELNSEAKHKTVAEFKREMANKEIEKQLVIEYGAPEYVNHQDEFVTKDEYQEAYKEFQEYLGDFFGEDNFSWRETTLQEKAGWVEEHYQGKIKSLEKELFQMQELSEGRKTALESISEEYDKKVEELSKINSEASESLSELSEVSSNIKDKRNDLMGLEEQYERLKPKIEEYNKNLVAGRDFENDWRRKFHGDLKKPLIGKEYIMMEPETYDNARWAYVYQEHRFREYDKQISDFKSRISNEYSARMKIIDERDILRDEVKELRGENKYLFDQNKGLKERLDIATRKLGVWRKRSKTLMPKKEFQKLSRELNMIKPLKPVIQAVKVVKKVIEKGLSL